MKKSISNKKNLTGKQQQHALIENIVKNDTFFPKGIHIDDIDKTVVDTIKMDFEIQSEGKQIPILEVFSIQRYSEFMKTWMIVDDTSTIQLPFMCLVRDPVKIGTNLNETFNVPNTPTFNLWKRPVLKNGKKSVEYYQIPQPVNIDCNYTLHLFTQYLRVVNKLDELILHAFKSHQYYIFVNGHSMPMILGSMEDTSNTSDIEKRRFYHKTYSLVVKGYLLREEDFKKLSSIDKIDVLEQPSLVKNTRECIVTSEDLNCDLCLNFKFNRKSNNSKSIKIPMDIEFYYDNQNSSNIYNYFINGSIVFLPFKAKAGDDLIIAHNIISNKPINIKVCGTKL